MGSQNPICYFCDHKHSRFAQELDPGTWVVENCITKHFSPTQCDLRVRSCGVMRPSSWPRHCSMASMRAHMASAAWPHRHHALRTSEASLCAPLPSSTQNLSDFFALALPPPMVAAMHHHHAFSRNDNPTTSSNTCCIASA